jgi:MFS family permease
VGRGAPGRLGFISLYGGFLHPAVRGQSERPPACRGGQAHAEPRLRLGVRQPLHLRSGLRLLDYYQAYYLLEKIGSAETEVPQQIFLATLVQAVLVVAASLVGGRLSDRIGRRKIFVLTASIVYGLALFVVAAATTFSGFLLGMALGGLGFGMYVAVDLALVADVLPNKDNAKDLGVFNIASALPFSIAPAMAPAILTLGGGSYGVLYAVGGSCAILGALAILPVRGVR